MIYDLCCCHVTIASRLPSRPIFPPHAATTGQFPIPSSYPERMQDWSSFVQMMEIGMVSPMRASAPTPSYDPDERRRVSEDDNVLRVEIPVEDGAAS